MAASKIASVFIDLETLGKYDDAVILSMGLTYLMDSQLKEKVDFDTLLKQTKEYKYEVKSQLALGRKTTKDVMEFWGKQKDAGYILRPNEKDIHISSLFQNFVEFLESNGLSWKTIRIFDRNSFDMSKIQHLWEQTLGCAQYVPWDYKDVWEIATFLKYNSVESSRYGFCGPKDFKHPSFVYHSAGCDAALDALRFHDVFQNRDTLPQGQER